MDATPKISVVMPVYNAAAYLHEAVRSILDQTFQDFEFVIINNGSTDETPAMLDDYQRQDRRVRVHCHEQNGWAPAVNYGCRLARGRYIAMMDGDDFSFPQRLERQLAWIEKFPKVGVVGSWVNKLKNGIASDTWQPPTNSKTLKWNNFFGVCMALPSVLMRRDVLAQLGFYREELLHAGDVDFYLRASAVTDFGVVPEVLYRYRVWQGSNTQRHLEIVRDVHVRLLASFIRDILKTQPDLEAVAGLRRTRVGPLFNSPQTICSTAALIQQLYRQFLQQHDPTEAERAEITWDAAKRLASLALQASRFDTGAFMRLFVQAMRLDHRLLYPASVARGVERRREFAAGGE
jgi:glycosyltransferase involved in cell wall biosynthesis